MMRWQLLVTCSSVKGLEELVSGEVSVLLSVIEDVGQTKDSGLAASRSAAVHHMVGMRRDPSI